MRKTFSTHAANDNPTTEASSGPRICLALQGGGSHGAYEWGVLQALHENDLLKHVKGLYGTSAGALNAVALSYGLNKNDPDLAMDLVNKIWEGVSQTGQSMDLTKTFTKFMFPFLSNPFKPQYPNLCPTELSQGQNWLSMMASAGMNYQTSDIKKRLQDTIPDWDVIRSGSIETVIGVSKPVSYKGTTYLQEILVSNKDLDTDWVTASATIIGTHKIAGDLYVDGGFTNNPPLPSDQQSGKYTDLVALMVSERPDGPLAPDLQSNNVNHDSFLYDEPWQELAHIRQLDTMHVHVSELKKDAHWNQTSKMNSEPRFIEDLRQRGYQDGLKLSAELKQNLGKRSSFNPEIAPAASYKLDNRECAVAL